MKSRILICITAMTLFAALAVPVRLAAQEQKLGPPRYAVKDLGTLGGTFSEALGVSNAGWVAGDSTLLNDTADLAVLWRHGKMTNLGTLGGPNSFAWGLNDLGNAVGAAESSTPDPLAEDWCGFGDNLKCLPFFWRNDIRKMIALPPPGGNNGAAAGINDLGEMVGQAENATIDSTCPYQALQIKPVIWRNGKVHELPTFPGDPVGAAWAINNWGQAVGQSGNCTMPSFHALLWQNGKATDLGNLGGTMNNEAYDLNNWGQVVGRSNVSGDTAQHAFLWQKRTGMIDLGTLPLDVLSVAVGINNAGQVVGDSVDASDTHRAFLWQNGVMTDLNTLIPSDSPLYLLTANKINDWGQITGTAWQMNLGEEHAYLATPIWYTASSAATAAPSESTQRPAITLPENVRKLLQRRGPLGRFKGGLIRPQ